MIFVFSTSSVWAGVAAVRPDGEVVWTGRRHAPQAAGPACLALLEESGVSLESATGFVADVGPGSFTGVRVGVTLAKTFGYLGSVPTAGVPAFDLISRELPAVVPNRKGEWFLRLPGQTAELVRELPAEFVGYGAGDPETFPDPARVAGLLGKLRWVGAEALTPAYLVEPSISQPKRAYGVLGG